jgi:hypothetical protein
MSQAGRSRVLVPMRYLPHHGPDDYSASNRNDYQKVFLRAKERPVLNVENLSAIYEPNV